MKLALIGYGKMGKTIERIAKERGHEIVCIIDIDNRADFDSDAFRSAEVAIEFTAPTAAYNNVTAALAQGVKVVSGSTGWTDRLPEIKALCDNKGASFFYSSNYSIGVNIFFALNKYLAKIMNQFPQYDPNLEEVHHVHKLDAPSGTAITLAEGIVDNLDRKERWGLHETKPEVLRIDDIRRGEVPGIHSITWDSEADFIKITHSAYSRKGFALGAVLAAEYTNEHEGLLTISDMFKF